jgi:RNA polymerase I-specific transcription initiation factor RRN6
MRLTISDVDEASARLRNISLDERQQSSMSLHFIASSHILELGDNGAGEPPTIASLYDTILQNWIAPLPADIPVRARQGKERLARRIAAEIVLASTQIRCIEEPLWQLDSHPGPSQDSGVALSLSTSPSRLSGPSSSQLSSSLPRLSRELPTSVPPIPGPLDRLSKRLRIEKLAAHPIPSGISRILSHWQSGTDPNAYNWEAAEEAMQDDTEVDGSRQEMREKAQRKKERREKRQKREDDMFKATTISQPQMLRSSPGPFFGPGTALGMSSQVPPTSQVQSLTGMFGGFDAPGVQSQVESGKHGGRPPIKRRKGKKRVGGF